MMPRYGELKETGQMAKKAEEALKLLGKPCRVCPHYCDVDRQKDERATCQTGRFARVHSFGVNFGIEPPLRGWKGSGSISFSGCNLSCVFCQKHSTGLRTEGQEMKADELAGAMLDFQERGCHNISFVNASHVVPQIVEAIEMAAERGLRIPIAYVSCTFDSRESLAALDGLIDLYVAEFRFGRDLPALKYTLENRFAEVSRASVREMSRQVGPLVQGEGGVGVRGLLLRHLVMPKDVSGTRDAMRFVARELGPETYVNLVADYEPACRTNEFPEINRETLQDEYKQAIAVAYEEGIRRVDAKESWF